MQTHALSSPYRNLIGNLEPRECTQNIVPQKKTSVPEKKLLGNWRPCCTVVTAIYALNFLF